MRFSLIIPTYNREKELKNCLNSLINQTYKNFEIIVVDQTENSSVEELCAYFQNEYSFNIKYFYLRERGGSRARNLGIDNATGDIVTFPDDDCEYFPETLHEVNEFFINNNDADAVLGMIEDKNGKKIIRKWPDTEKRIYKRNFFLLYSAITLFLKNDNIIKFSEEMGSGAKIGAYEDADYMLRLINNSKKIIYSPKIKLWHPDINKDNVEKMYSYGLGFGYFCRKNFSFYTFYLFLLVLSYHFARLLKGIIFLKKKIIILEKGAIKSRIIGFCQKKPLID